MLGREGAYSEKGDDLAIRSIDLLHLQLLISAVCAQGEAWGSGWRRNFLQKTKKSACTTPIRM